jgi:hypothetical protein
LSSGKASPSRIDMRFGGRAGENREHCSDCGHRQHLQIHYELPRLIYGNRTFVAYRLLGRGASRGSRVMSVIRLHYATQNKLPNIANWRVAPTE